jgi:hypothetical protein
VLSDESAFQIAAPGPARCGVFIKLMLQSLYCLPLFSLYALAASLTLTDTDLPNWSLPTIYKTHGEK